MGIPMSPEYNVTTEPVDTLLQNNRTLRGLDGAHFTNSSVVHCGDANEHMLYHLGNLCIAASFLTLSSFKYHLVFLRSFFIAGFIPLALWAGFMKCMLDLVLWDVTIMMICLVYIAHHVYVFYSPKLERSLDELYNKTFKPLKVTIFEYESLVRLGNVKILNAGLAYAVEDSTISGYRISILLRGRLKVSHNNYFLHYISPDEFIDSIEYEGIDTGSQHEDTYQVTITAEEDCSLITWQQNELDDLLQTNPFLGVLIRNLLGRDISTKMYHIQELLLASSRKRHKLANCAKSTTCPSTTTRSYIRLNSISGGDEQSEPLLPKSSSYETCV